jgi:choline-sulfatase
MVFAGDPSEIDCLDNRVQLGSDLPTFAHGFTVSGYETILSGRMHIVGPDQHHGFEHRLVGDTPGTAYFNADWADEVAGLLKNAMGGSALGFEKSGAGRTGFQAFDEHVADKTSQWLLNRGTEEQEGTSGRPFMMVAGLFFPHNPWIAPVDDYEPPHPLHRRMRESAGWDVLDKESQVRVRRAYYAMCTTMDRTIGQILGALDDSGMADNTIVVYTSDHGESLGRHGIWGKNTFFDESAKIPPPYTMAREHRGVII